MRYVEHQPNMNNAERAERWAEILGWMGLRGRTEAECEGRRKMFTRWGRAIKGNNVGSGATGSVLSYY